MSDLIKPTFDEKKEVIQEFENTYFINSIGESMELMNPLFTGYWSMGLNLAIDLLLFRGIKYSEKPNFVSETSYPPPEYAKMNRASELGESMFYCTTNKKVIFYELKLQPGDKIVISTWRVVKNIFVNSIGYTKNNLENLGYEGDAFKWDEDGNNNPILDEENMYMNEYFSKCFSQNIESDTTNLYKKTIPIAKRLFHDDLFMGLIYPTIQYNAKYENLAIIPKALDNQFLEAIEFEFIEVVEIIDGRYKYKIIDYADTKSENTIEWLRLTNQWTRYDDDDDLYFVKIDGKYEAYNQYGDNISADNE